MKKRILSVILILCMVLTFVPTTVFAAEGITPTTPQKDTGGVYQIGTAAELYGFAQLVNSKAEPSANAVLTADITVNDFEKTPLEFDDDNNVTNGNSFESWTPIGNNSNKYTGTFDGQNHTISGLYFNNPSTDYVGLFGYLGGNGVIKNVGVIDSYFNGREQVGGVCGQSDGTITDCYNTGTVSGDYNVGGVCGFNGFGKITGCYNTGTVSGSTGVGGVCGFNFSSGSTITGCYNTGAVSGYSYVGGVCGTNMGTITGCYTNRDDDTYYISNDEFKNGTVCGLLNAALQNANASVRYYQGANYPKLCFIPALVDGVYQIGTAAELYGFAQLVNSGNTDKNTKAVLTADITVNNNLLSSLEFDDNENVTNGNSFTDWTPIGNLDNRYTGTFDGQGHTISGLYFNDENTMYVGLFGFLGTDGEIKNVGVIDSYFNGGYRVGGVCGVNDSTITGCYNTGTVSGEDIVGGVCGYNEDNGTITGCYNTGTVSGRYEVGGVCGLNYSGTTTDCYNTGDVNGLNYVGGICGRIESRCTITGCYNTGTVSSTGNDVGGVCGFNGVTCTITGCYNTGEVSGGVGSSNVGGVCGRNEGKITGNYSIGTVSGESCVGGVCGFNVRTITGCYTNNKGICGINTGTISSDCAEYIETESEDKFKDGTVCGLLNTALKNENSDVRFYQGVKSPEFIHAPQLVDDVYQIGTAAELYGFAQLVNSGNTSASAVLTADITVNNNLLSSLVFDDNNNVTNGNSFESWTPIGNLSNRYTGKFDGQGHTISGLYFNDTGTNFVGLFSTLYRGGEIKNVGVIDSYLYGNNAVGGVCGRNDNGTINGCYNTGTVSGTGNNVGGVSGDNIENGTITGCYNTGTVSGSGGVGGVCGLNYDGKITGCYSIGTVSGSDEVGGVCGRNDNGTINDCYNTGTVSGTGNYVGGVCGHNLDSTITGCYNTGEVSGVGSVGGVCGWNNSGTITGCYTNNKGICGENNNGTVTDCAEHKDADFANGTVCRLLNAALKNANSDVRFCQRIGTDVSPLLTYQFESIDEHTYEVYTVDNNTFKATCLCGKKDTKTMELTLTTEKTVVANGGENTLTATLSNYDNETVTYKWYQNNALLENATSNTYKMPTNLSLGTYTYKVDVAMENVGTITKSISVFVDNDPPTGEISVGAKSWTESPDNITFDLFFKDTQTVTITASDNSGKPITIEYLVSHKELTADELANATFTAYSDTFNINSDNEYVIYARLTDESGNVAYINSNGIVLDSVAPVISGIENGKTYCEAQTFTVTEKYIKSVTVNGTEVSLDENNQFTLNPAEGTQEIVVTDKAGNVSAEMIVTVNNGHTDENPKDHKCDICGENVGVHEDINKDHKCDYGCNEPIGEHKDENSDHKCDYGCAEAIGEHKDDTKDHKCDYGCDEPIGEHKDEDSDHKCDYGCDEAIGEHKDEDSDHKCDYGCAEAIGEHKDEDSDHKCDYGCNEPIGEHKDEDNDHKCDYGCAEAIGEHKVADGKHTCGYCGKEMTTCKDENPIDHKCDICGETLSQHSGGTATCTNKAICDICGKPYGELDSTNHNLEHIPAKKATVTQEGNIEYWHCIDCGKYFSDKDGKNSIELKDTGIAKLPAEDEQSCFAPLMLKAENTKNKTVKLTWTKLKDAKGYIVYGVKCGNDLKKIKTVKGNSYTIKNLKKGIYYKYMVVAYKTVDGKQVTISNSKIAHVAVKGGKYGNATKITVNKIKPIKQGEKLTLKVTVKTDKKVKNHVPIRYESTNTKIAKVSSKGVITAKAKGECNVYVYAQNGVYKKVKVTVK